MTKTLTEQWREGKLPDGAYYILVDKYEQNEPEIDIGVCYNSNFEWWIVKEVLAPVPSYDEIKRLQEQLNEAQHTIYCIANTDGSDCKTILETITRDANLYLKKWGV